MAGNPAPKLVAAWGEARLHATTNGLDGRLESLEKGRRTAHVPGGTQLSQGQRRPIGQLLDQGQQPVSCAS